MDGSKDPIRPTLLYVARDGILYSIQDNEEWLCIPSTMTNDILRTVHDDQGHQGIDRSWTKMQGLVIYKGWKRLKDHIATCPECLWNNPRCHKPRGSLQPILTPPIPFHTLTIDFVTGLPKLTDGYGSVAFFTCKFSKRMGSVAGKPTWTGEQCFIYRAFSWSIGRYHVHTWPCLSRYLV